MCYLVTRSIHIYGVALRTLDFSQERRKTPGFLTSRRLLQGRILCIDTGIYAAGHRPDDLSPNGLNAMPGQNRSLELSSAS